MFQFPIKKPSSANVVVAWLLFHISVYLTLTFDFVTLTIGQLQYLININPMYDFDQDPTISSWFIGKKSSMPQKQNKSFCDVTLPNATAWPNALE